MTNEFEEVKALFLTPGTSLELAKPMLTEMVNNLNNLGHALPQACYTDKCCCDRK